MAFFIVMDRFHMTMWVYQNNEEASILVYQKQKGIGARNDGVCSLSPPSIYSNSNMSPRL